MGELAGQTAFVAGATGTLGGAIALELAEKGAHVLASGRCVERLAELASQISRMGGQCTTLSCDLTDEVQLTNLASQLRTENLKLHILVHAVGTELFKPLQLTRVDEGRQLMDSNVLSAANLIRTLLNLLETGASVVFLSSAAGICGQAGMTLYSASKAALLGMTRSLARELSGRKIRVNAIAPGMVQSEMLERLLSKLPEAQRQQTLQQHPLGFGTPEDVAWAVGFLAGPRSRWITGQTLVVDGGLTS
jgi:NAD(P)-dependent dehydrogenase (short-subunit alcohol dehydrogenase family)